MDRGVQADPTAYFGSIPINATLGTEIFPFRIVIDISRFNNDLEGVIIIIYRNNLAQTIFGFNDGQNYRAFEIGALGGIDSENASREFPEINLIENRLVVYEDRVIYRQALPHSSELPLVLDFDVNFIAVGRSFSVYQEFWPLAVGTVTITAPPGMCKLVFAYTNDTTLNRSSLF